VGEVRDDVGGDGGAWDALVGHGRRHRDAGLGALADRMAEVEPPAAADRSPVVIDTDVGDDPDDAVALAVAARTVPELALVVTSDERRGDRAGFARSFLRSLGRGDVPVVAGRDLGRSRGLCVDWFGGDAAPAAPADVAAAVAAVGEDAGGRVRWVGLGPMSNLADVLDARPGLADVLDVTQTGGALDYRDPGRAEHNIRLDVEAAEAVLAAARRVSFVTSDVTFRPEETAVAADGPVYRHLARSREEWAGVLRGHLDRWYATRHPASLQHDPLTLSAALRLPFVDFALRRLRLDAAGRMRLDPVSGVEAFLSVRADYGAFTRWLHRGLGVVAEKPGAAAGPQKE
jgi:inosine-uridine nucleoside N-ribohydrolase